MLEEHVPVLPRRFRIALLGALEVERDGERLSGPWPSRARRLLTLLATAPCGVRRREELIDLLWPEASASAGASNLRHAVHQLRRTLGVEPPAVLSTGGWVQLNPADVWEVDMVCFEAHIEEGLRHSREGGDADARQALSAALALYRGEPLPEERYDEWAAGIRERALARWREASLRLSEWRLAAGDMRGAFSAVEPLVQHDPLDEAAVQVLLGTLLPAGRPREARRVYDQFAARLEVELDEAPSPETDAIIADPRALVPAASALAPPPVAPPAPTPQSAPFVGRTAELALIAAIVRGERMLPGESEPTRVARDAVVQSEGAASLVLIAGEAGLGKTRLLAEAAQRAATAGTIVLSAACQEHEGGLPYGAIHDILRTYLRSGPPARLRTELGDLLPELVPLVPMVASLLDGSAAVASDRRGLSARGAGGRLQLFAAVARTLERIATDRPLLLVLDDLYWADTATLELLHYLVRRLAVDRQRGDPAITILGAYRAGDVDADSPLSRLTVAGGTRTIQLGPLSQTELFDLLGATLPAQPGPVLTAALFERTAGNPFFALEMLTMLQVEGRLRRTDAGLELAGREVGLPDAVRQVVGRRLQELGPQVRELLTLAAVLGGTCEYSVLAAMWEGDDATLFELLDRAVAAHILMEVGEGYAFRHPVLQEVVYDTIPAGRRPLLHGRAGLALETIYVREREAHAPELAHHFWMARRLHRERALHYSLQAGDAAARVFAHDQAERYFRMAIELAKELADREQEAIALEKLGTTLRFMDQYAPALDVLEHAAIASANVRNGELERRIVAQIGRVHALRAATAVGIERLHAFLVSAGEVEPTPGMAALYNALAQLYGTGGQPDEALAASTRAMEIAEALGDAAGLAEAQMRRGTGLYLLGQNDDALAALDFSAEIADSVGDLDTLVRALNNASTALYQKGSFGTMKAYAERALETANRLGDPARIASTRAWLAEVLFYVGDWVSARCMVEQAVEAVQPFGRIWLAYQCFYVRGRIAAFQGDWRRAKPDLAEALAIADQSRDDRGQMLAHAVLARYDLWGGHPERVLSRLEPFDELLVLRAEAHLLLGQTGDVDQLCDESLRQSGEPSPPPAYMEVLRVKALARTMEGHWAEAERMFGEALALARNMPYPYAEANVLYGWGKAAVERGLAAEGRLQEALAIFTRLGAKPSATLAEQALAGCGRRA